MDMFFQGVGVILVWLIRLALLIATALWAFSNIWLLLGILAALVVIGIIYAMVTSDNELVSGLTLTTFGGIGMYILYLIAN